MKRDGIKISSVLCGSRKPAAAPPKPSAPVLSVDMNSMTFNIAWDGTPVEHWEVYYSNHPPGNFSRGGQVHLFPTDYWNLVSDFNVDWALFLVGCDGDGNEITPHSNVLTGHSPAHA